MSKNTAENSIIDLKSYLSLNNQAMQLLKDKTELSSKQRNAIAKMPYPLNIAILARRGIYHAHTQSQQLEPLRSCEAQAISDFLEGT